MAGDENLVCLYFFLFLLFDVVVVVVVLFCPCSHSRTLTPSSLSLPADFAFPSFFGWRQV